MVPNQMGRQLMGHLSDATVGHRWDHYVCTVKADRSGTVVIPASASALARFTDLNIPYGIARAFEIAVSR
jgi:hypothetical protein